MTTENQTQDEEEVADAADAVEVLETVDKLCHAGVEAEDLDEAVHDVASTIASEINNAGLAAQVEFLLSNGIPAARIIEDAKKEALNS